MIASDLAVFFIPTSSNLIMASARKKMALKQKQMGHIELRSATTSPPQIEAGAQIQVDILCMLPAASGMLVSHIDNVSKSIYSTVDGKLHLQLHVLALAPQGAVTEFSLGKAAFGADEGLGKAIEATAISSPGMAASHPQLDWAASARFIVDTVIDVPNLGPGDLLSILARTRESSHTVARLYLTSNKAIVTAPPTET